MDWKTLLIAFVVFSIAYSSVSSTSNFNVNLDNGLSAYNNSFRFDTNVQLTQALSVATDGKVLGSSSPQSLENNAKICAGTLNISSDISGSWAGLKLDVVSIFPECNPQAADCPDMTPYTSITKQSVQFVSKTKFEEAFDYFQTSDYYSSTSGGTPPSFLTSDLHNEKVGYIIYSDVKPDKLGRTAFICRGGVNLKVVKTGGTTTTLFYDMNAPDMAEKTFDAKSEGTYTITQDFSKLDCLGVVKLSNTAGMGFYDSIIYGFAINGAGVLKNPLETKLTLTVADPQLDFTATKKYPLENQLQMEPNSEKDLFFEFKNTGDVKLKVDKITAGTGTTAGFTVTAAPATVFYPLQAANIQNGFNMEILPGQTKIIVIRVHSPANVPSNSKVDLEFQVTATEKTCADKAKGDKLTAEGFEFKPWDYEFPILPLPVLKSCEFVPSSQTVEVENIANYTLYCYDKLISDATKTKVDCLANGMEVSVSPQSVAVLSQSPKQSAGPKTDVKLETLSVGTASVKADNNLPNPHVYCNASLTVKAKPSAPQPDSCTLAQSPLGSNQINQTSLFLMACFSSKIQIDCPKSDANLTVKVTNGIGNYAGYVPPLQQNALVAVENKKYGNGTVTVSEKYGKYSCSALISVPQPPPEQPPQNNTNITNVTNATNYCLIAPSGITTLIGKPNAFTLTCNEQGKNVTCKGVTWNVDGLTANMLGSSDSFVQLSFSSDGTAVLSAKVQSTAGLPREYFCAARIDVNQGGQIDRFCTVSPDRYSGKSGDVNQFNISCFATVQGANVKPKSVPCTNVEWHAFLKGREMPIINGNNYFSIIKFGNSGAWDVAAAMDNVTCSAYAYISAATKPPTEGNETADSCNITVVENVEYGNPFSADITCYSSKTGKLFPCENVTWGLENGHGTITGDDTVAKCTLTQSDVILAQVNGELQYVCKLSVGENKKKCTITPRYWIAQPFAKKDFTVRCEKEDCDSITWGNSYPEYIQVTNEDPFNKSKATVEIYKDPKKQISDGVVYVDAKYNDEKYYCEADVYVGALMCVNYI